MANLQDLYNAILNGKLEQAVAVTQEAINEGISPTEIINQYMVKARFGNQSCLCNWRNE